MSVSVRSIQTVVPDTVLIQNDVRDVFAAQDELNRLAERIIATSFDTSGIETRHTAIKELTFAQDERDPTFFDASSKTLLMPGTKARNELYADAATPLFVETARRALDGAAGITAEDVTHVITVSCTGFYAPGPDFMIAQELSLAPGVQRYHLGFMGCYAAMPALRAAAQFCEADPNAVVLVVSVELCTLHLRSSTDPDTIVASSLFADGAAGAVVTGRAPAPGEKGLDLSRFETVVTPVGESDMAWTVGDEGFEMVLSTYVPKIIDEHMVGALEPLFASDDDLADALANDSASDRIEHWAIHPGGRSILDRVENRLGLTDDQLVPARATLRDFGNMSSATILFVLKHILEQPDTRHGERVAAMAFGPGLTVESGLFTVVEG